MFASKGFRLSALFAALVTVFSVVAVDTAEARRGGSFGSRGMRTERSIPSTQVSPGATAPVQRTVTQPGVNRSATNTAATQRPQPSLFGGIGGAILGGLLFSGLFGLLFGFGFGGFGGFLSLLVQAGLLFLIIFLVSRWLRNRRQPVAAGAGPLPYEGGRDYHGGGNGARPTQRSNASQRAGKRDEIGITDQDLSTFERLLAELQDAYSREDYAAIRRITTPEVMSYLAEELAENSAKGVRNEVYDVKLLAGDVAEAWREGNNEYATAALRYESRDAMRDRNTGQVVSGEDRPTETTELWTFTRPAGGRWLVSAIQEA